MNKIKLLKKENEIYLQLLAAIEYETLLQELESMGINLSPEMMVEILHNPGKEILIPSESIPAENNLLPPDRENLFELEVAANNMQAWITVSPGVNQAFSWHDIKSELIKRGIVYGLDEADLKRAFSNPGNKVAVARGKEAVPGLDACIDYIHESADKKPVLLEDGSVDYYKLGHIIPVHAGDTIAIRKPATEGTPGSDIFGHEIPAPGGKAMNFNVGKGIIIMENSAIAEYDGAISWVNNKVFVTRIYTVKGDVDFSVGNIDFKGKVLIQGNIGDGFRVEADDDIDIQGGVGNAHIVSRRGSIFVQKGIIGRGKASLEACKNIEAKFIQEAAVKAGQNIVVNEYIMRCYVEAGDSVLIQGKKGRIMGNNTISARTKIKASGIQNCGELDLRVEGIERKEAVQKVKELNKLIDYKEGQLIKTAAEIRNLRAMKAEPASLENLKILLPEYIKLVEQLDGLIEQRDLMVNMLKTTRGEGMIEIGSGVEQGMFFTIKNESIKLDKALNRISMYYDPDMKKIVFF